MHISLQNFSLDIECLGNSRIVKLLYFAGTETLRLLHIEEDVDGAEELKYEVDEAEIPKFKSINQHSSCYCRKECQGPDCADDERVVVKDFRYVDPDDWSERQTESDNVYEDKGNRPLHWRIKILA